MLSPKRGLRPGWKRPFSPSNTWSLGFLLGRHALPSCNPQQLVSSSFWAVTAVPFAIIASLDSQLLWSPFSTISSSSACKINDRAAICSYQSTCSRNPVNGDSLLCLLEVTTAENRKIVTEQEQIHSTDILEGALPVLMVAKLIK